LLNGHAAAGLVEFVLDAAELGRLRVRPLPSTREREIILALRLDFVQGEQQQ